MSIYVSDGNEMGAVAETTVEAIRQAWNKAPNFLGKARKHVKRISIIPASRQHKALAQWQNAKKVMKFYVSTHGLEQLSDNYQTQMIFATYHEMAHVWFDRERELDSDKLKQFCKTVFKLSPFNEYLQKNEKTWKEAYLLWPNEVHSAVVEIIFGGNLRNVSQQDPNFQQALEAFNELHDETFL